MKFLTIFVVFLLSFNTSLHAETDPANESKRVMIGITDQSGSAIGLSLIPPNEPNWDTKKAGLSITLKRAGKATDENQEIEAYMIRLDKPFHPVSTYMEQIRKNTEEGYKKNPDFKLSAFDIKEYPQNPQCVRVYMLLEDVRTTRADLSQKKWSEQHMLSCGLSKHKRIGFEVRYYNRHYDQNKDELFATKADRLFETVIIEDK
ncbi:MAG: hypothetical protein REI95_12440 [Oxalicibacterium faecigallinarum]|nr:hypothetical protein [Oxalicibacterium faecigallinarum]MDQ7970441.1 hypothetical protein [Oxalicibacterium faecigallinarum]